MAQDKTFGKRPSELRRQAEELLRQRPEAVQDIPGDDTKRLIHDLQVHQVELELQNEELRKAHLELEELVNKYFDLYELAPVGYFTLEQKGLIGEANLTAAALLGVQMRNLIGRRFSPFVAPDFQDVFYFHQNRVFATRSKQTCELKLVKKDGTSFYAHLESIAVQNAEGNPNQLRTALMDITDRKRAEEALRASEERYRSVLQANPDPVVVCDMAGEIVYLNPAFELVFGLPKEERLGQGMGLFVTEEDWSEVKMMIDKVPAGKNISGFATLCYAKDGNIIPVSLSAAVYRDRDGNIVGRVINLRDISAEKKLETQLQHAQKMEAVGTLAGGMAHEFNNLLHAVQGYAGLLLLKRNKEEPGYRELQEIVRAAKRGGELGRQLLTFSRKVESKLRPVDLQLEVERTASLLSHTIPRMIEIEVQLEKGLKTVYADPSQIEQILVNLAVNAKDAMSEAGKLLIEAKNVALDEEYCRMHPEAIPGEYVVLSLTDTGTGMDKGTLKRIFDPFFTTKGVGRGTGLGLAIVYGIVKSHNGFIICDSEPGLGSTFKIYLPVVEREARPHLEEGEVPIGGGTETILVVDDEDIILDLARETLAEFGYTVLTATDGEKALEIYSEQQEGIDLVMLDLIMPGMGGRKCLEKLTKLNPDVKVLVASGYSPDGPTKDSLRAGAKGFVTKPYDTTQILKVIRDVLDRQ